MSILFSVFCFEINQCDSDRKTEKKSVNALLTDKLLLSTNFKIVKLFLNVP